jgi:LacI family kdg operon repressor
VIVNALGVKDETLEPLSEGGIPAVLVDRQVAGFDADIVGLDNADAVKVGMQHLFERGFDEIHFIVQPFERVSSRRVREAAFREVMSHVARIASEDASGSTPRVHGQTVVLDLADPEAVMRTHAALDRCIDTAMARSSKRIAFFSANALVGLSLARHLNSHYGPRWQERVALMSVDDPEWTELTGITTIRQPTYAIGYRTVEFLHERIEGVLSPAREAMLPGKLVLRGSTAR